MFYLKNIKPLLALVTMFLVLLTIAATAPINGVVGDGFGRFLGRFHILVLHFPVTLLILAPALSLYNYFRPNNAIKPFVKLIWALGSLFVFITVAMGMLLAANEGLEISEVRLHMLGGLTVALLTFIATAITFHIKSKPWHKHVYSITSGVLVLCLFITAHAGGNLVHGETYLVRFAPAPINKLFQPEEKVAGRTIDDERFNTQIRPVLDKYCFSCHGSDTQKGGVQLDILDPDFVKGLDAPQWHAALDMINTGDMPPPKKKQPNEEERRLLVEWLTDGVQAAKEAKKGKSKKVLRRLTKQQYQNTLTDLIGIDSNVGLLPDDPLSAIGFSNNAELLQNSTLHLETFEQIARRVLDKAIDPEEKPEVMHYRMHFGKDIGIGESHSKSKGYLAVALETEDFKVEVLDESGQPKPNDELGDLKKYFSASLRGSSKQRFKVQPKGVSLYSAKPHKEINKPGAFGSWHAPSPNISMQVKKYFPQSGQFAVRVKASKSTAFNAPVANKYMVKTPDGISINQLSNQSVLMPSDNAIVLNVAKAQKLNNVEVSSTNDQIFLVENGEKTGAVELAAQMPNPDLAYYEMSIVHLELAKDEVTDINISLSHESKLNYRLTSTGRAKHDEPVISKLGLVMLKGKSHRVTVNIKDNFPGFSHFILTPKTLDHDEQKLFANPSFTNQINSTLKPVIVPYIGSRTDDGIDYKTLNHHHTLTTDFGESEIYTFYGRLESFPLPANDVQGDQWVSGSLKIGVWNGDMITDGSDKGSVLNVDYIEFEAPYIEQWPTASHRKIFIDSTLNKTSPEYAKLVIKTFAQRAYRRAVSDDELQLYFDFWKDIQPDFERFEDGIKETLVAILSSTNFLYLAEPQDEDNAEIVPSDDITAHPNTLLELLGLDFDTSNESEDVVSDYALANRLSYFLWNSPPDSELLELAKRGELKDNVDTQVKRMLKETLKLKRFVNVFSSEWLRLDRLLGQSVDVESFPDFTRFVKKDMMLETTEFLTYLIQQDLSALNIIESDFTMLNQNLADFYGIPNITGVEFRKVLLNDTLGRGGLLGQGSFLTGHADGVHSHPVKRAVWLKSKILGVEPPPPPPNVPELESDTPGFDKLTLKQQLELHRDKDSCRDCHAKIDPYGIVFENYDAVGRYRKSYKGSMVDTTSILPDGIAVEGMEDIKHYLLNTKKDQVAMSLLKHMFAYSLGREVSFHDDTELDMLLQEVKSNDYSMQSMILAIINSPSFNRR